MDVVIALLKLLWQRWKVVAHKIGDVQARLLLSMFYFVVVGPFALGTRLTSDPLRLRCATLATWLPRLRPVGSHLISARRQF